MIKNDKISKEFTASTRRAVRLEDRSIVARQHSGRGAPNKSSSRDRVAGSGAHLLVNLLLFEEVGRRRHKRARVSNANGVKTNPRSRKAAYEYCIVFGFSGSLHSSCDSCFDGARAEASVIGGRVASHAKVGRPREPEPARCCRRVIARHPPQADSGTAIEPAVLACGTAIILERHNIILRRALVYNGDSALNISALLYAALRNFRVEELVGALNHALILAH